MLDDVISAVATRYGFRASDYKAVWDGGKFDPTREDKMDEQHGVFRQRVADVVRAMMLFPQVKWVAVIYEDTVEGMDRFCVVPYTSDPTA